MHLVNYKLRLLYWLMYNIPHSHSILSRKWNPPHLHCRGPKELHVQIVKVKCKKAGWQESQSNAFIHTKDNSELIGCLILWLKACHTHLRWYTGDAVNTVPKSWSAQTSTMVLNSYSHMRKHFTEGKYQFCFMFKDDYTILQEKAEKCDKSWVIIGILGQHSPVLDYINNSK